MKIKPFIWVSFFLFIKVCSIYGQEDLHDDADKIFSIVSEDIKTGSFGEIIEKNESSPLMMFREQKGSVEGTDEGHLRNFSLARLEQRQSFESFDTIREQSSERNFWEEPLSAETILKRGYLNIEPNEFQIVVGETESFWSWQASILSSLKKYHQLTTDEEKQNLLSTLDQLTRAALKAHQEFLRQEQQKLIMNIDQGALYQKRIVACKLLLRGIDVERRNLNGIGVNFNGLHFMETHFRNTQQPATIQDDEGSQNNANNEKAIDPEDVFYELSLDRKDSTDFGISFRRDSTRTIDSDFTEGTRHSTQVVKTFFDAAEIFLNSSRLYFEPYLQVQENNLTFFSQGLHYLKRQFFQPLSQEIEPLVFKTNGHLLKIHQREQLAQRMLVDAETKLSDQTSLEQKKYVWGETVVRFKELAEAFANTIESYKEEAQELLPERQARFEETKRKNELCSIKLHWAYLHHAEITAALAWLSEEQGEGLPSSQQKNQKLLEAVIQAQQAWRELMGFLESDFDNPSSEWKELWTKNFELAKRVEYGTPFFDQWLHAAQDRYHAIAADFISNRIEYNRQECRTWKNLLNDLKDWQESFLEVHEIVKEPVAASKYLLEEAELQWLYALAEQAALETIRLKEEVQSLASRPLIDSSIYEIQGHVHKELSIVSAKYDEIKKLCNVWQELKKQRSLEIESLSNVAISCYRYAQNADKKNKQPDTQKAFLTTAIKMPAQQYSFLDEQDLPFIKQDHGLYEQVRKKLLKAHEEVVHWKPLFPSIRLERWGQLTNTDEASSFYILKTHDDIVPMERLVEEVKTCKHPSLEPYLRELHEMIGDPFQHVLDSESSSLADAAIAEVLEKEDENEDTSTINTK